MSIESLIDDAQQFATITAEAPDGQVPPQTTMGGADRSDPNWVTVAAGIACLVYTRNVTIDYDRNDQRASVVSARIYLMSDPTANGLSSRNRITVTSTDQLRPRLVGIYAVLGAVVPVRGSDFMVMVDCERIRTP